MPRNKRHSVHMGMDVILASASPRRRELLKTIVDDFAVIPSKFEERADRGLSPCEYVCALAEGKCGDVAKNHPSSLVIGCDTVVVLDNKILGKPKDAADAAATLEALSGREHEVITGVCLRIGERQLTDFCVTKVGFNELTREFIGRYVDSGSPMDKAGSYGIQDGGLVKSYTGSYTNVVGLPTELLKRMIKKILTDEQIGC